MLWKAVLSDGTEVWENPSTGTSSLYPGSVTQFQLTEGGIIKYSLVLDDYKQLLYRHRVALSAGSGEKISEAWIVGYCTIGNPKAGQLTTYHSDGTITTVTSTDGIEFFPSEIDYPTHDTEL